MIVLDLETIAAVPQDDPRYDALREEKIKRSSKSGDVQPTVDEFQALCPALARPVSAAIFNSETNKGRVLYDNSVLDCKDFEFELPDGDVATKWECVGLDGEKNVLFVIGQTLGQFKSQTLAGFNSKAYDLPVIFHRSRINGVPVAELVTRGLGQKPWEDFPHIDVANIANFGGAMQKYSLRVLALAYGLKDPKADASGDGVAELVKARDGDKVCRYAAGDVLTTWQLYKRMMGK